jgi:hypothetical protein
LRSRPYDWSNFLDVADELLSKVGGEGAERTAISRAYYGGYGVASAYARYQKLVLGRKGSDHTTVWLWYTNRPDRGTTHTRIAQAGQRLKRWRILADYDEGFADAASTATLALTTARQLLQDVRCLS